MCSVSANQTRTFENVEEKLNFAKELIDNVLSAGHVTAIPYIISLLFDSDLEKSVSLFIERNFLKKIHCNCNEQVVTAVNLAVVSFIEERVPMPNFEFLKFLPRFLNRWQYFKAIFESRSFAEQFSQYMYDALYTAVTDCKDVELKKSTVKSLYTFLFKVYPEIGKERCESMLQYVQTLLVNDLPKSDYEIKTLCGIILVEINIKIHGKQNDFDEDMILKVINPVDDLNLNIIERLDYSLYLWNGALSINPVKNTILNSKNLMKQCLCYMTSLADSEYLNAELCLKISRTILTVTKKMIGKIEQDKFESEDLNFTGILKFVWSTTENYYVLVKHVSVDILTNVIKLINTIGDKCLFLENLFSTVFAFSKFQAKKYNALLKMYSYIEEPSAKRILNRHLNNIVLSILNLGEIPVCMQISIKTCLVAILTYDLSEKTEEDWFAYWIQCFIVILKNQQFWMIEDLIGRAMQLKPTLIAYIGRITNKLNDELYLILFKCVSCLKHSDYSKYIDNDVLLASLIQQKSNIKLLALKIVIDKKKKSEVYSEIELYYVMEFLRYNSKIQISQDFDAVLSNIVKFFDAFEISYNAIIRDKIDVERIRYENFIENLYYFCISQLEFAEELTKLKLTLEILYRLVSSYSHIFPITNDDVSNIYRKIFVSYESIKKLVVTILVWLIQNKKTTQMELDVYNERIGSLIDSIKINDVTTAVYHLHIMIGCAPKSEPDRLCYIKLILNMLFKKLRTRMNSNMVLNVFLPYYGCFYGIRYVLEETRIFSPSLLRYVLNLCCTVFIQTEEFVFNESPEGAVYNFNMEPAIIDNDDLNWISDIFSQNSSHLVTQLILLNSWRCIKDICLIFAHFCEEIYNRDLVINYAYHIIAMTYIQLKLLRGAKHRAILEQSSECFERICYVLWRSGLESLQGLPRMFLNEHISLLRQETDSLEISRRSAGIPYLFKSILTSEDVMYPSNVFMDTMNKLLDMAGNTNTPIFSKIHVFNILTCLFQDRKLTKIISEFIEPAFMVAINVIKISLYGLLTTSIVSLYSALLRKIFGVNKKRCLSEENIYNITNSDYFGKLSSDEVQLKFPKLFEFIENNLKNYIDRGEQPGPLIYMLLRFLLHVYQTKNNDDSYELMKVVRQLSKIKKLFLHNAVTLVIARIVTMDQALKLFNDSMTQIYKYPTISYRRLHFNLYLLKNGMLIKECQITEIDCTGIYERLLDSSGAFDMQFTKLFFDMILSSMKEHLNPVCCDNFDIDKIEQVELKKKAIVIKMLHSKYFCDIFYRSRLDVLHIDMLAIVLTFKDVQLFNDSYSIFDHINALNINIENMPVTVFQQIYDSPVFHHCLKRHRGAIMNNSMITIHDNDITKIKKLLIYYYFCDTTFGIVSGNMLSFFCSPNLYNSKKNMYLVSFCLMRYLEQFYEYGYPQFDDILFATTLRDMISCDDDSVKTMCALMIGNVKLKWIFDRYNNSTMKHGEIRSLIMIIVLLLVDENPVVRNIATRVLENLNIDVNRTFETISPQYAVKLLIEYVQKRDDNIVIFHYLINELKIMQLKKIQDINKAAIYNPTVHNNYIELLILIRFLETYYQPELSPDNLWKERVPFCHFIGP